MTEVEKREGVGLTPGGAAPRLKTRVLPHSGVGLKTDGVEDYVGQ